MSKQHLRVDPRGSITGPVRLSWSNAAGLAVHVLGKCVDASRHGMKIEVTDPVPLLTSVGIYAERIGFAGTASVRHVAKAGRKYVVGLQLAQAIPTALLTRHSGLKDSSESGKTAPAGELSSKSR